MRIRYIEVFYAVMQCGTVSGAAKLLNVSQPAATRLLQQAEAHVGVALFQRVRGRLVPTAEALQLYPEVEQLYLKLDAVRRVVASLGRESKTLVRVLCVPGLALEALPPAMARCAAAVPSASFSVRTLHSRQICESLVLREAEVGFTFEPPSHPSLVSRPIAEGCIVSVGPDVPSGGCPIEQLSQHEVIDLDPTDPLGRLLHATWLGRGEVKRSRVVAQTYHAAIELAAQGFGWAIVDSMTARHARRHPGLRVAPITPPLPIAVHAVKSRDLPSSHAIDALIAAMAAVLAA